MKKTIMVFGILLLTCSSLFALENFGVKIVTDSSVNIQGIDINDTDGETNGREIEFSGFSPVYWGLTGDFVFDHIGLGITAQSSMYEDDNKDFITAWDLDLFLSYHFFGTDDLFDLFAEAGIGCAGMVNVDSRQDDSYITMDNARNEEYDTMDFMEMALYPHLAAGFAFNPGRKWFTFGAKLSVRPVAGKIPYAPIQFHDVSMFKATLFVGVVFNSSHRRDDDDSDFDFDEEDQEEIEEDFAEAREEYEEALSDLEEEMADDQESAEDEDFNFEFEEIEEEDAPKSNGSNINIDVNDGDRDVNININID